MIEGGDLCSIDGEGLAGTGAGAGTGAAVHHEGERFGRFIVAIACLRGRYESVVQRTWTVK